MFTQSWLGTVFAKIISLLQTQGRKRGDSEVIIIQMNVQKIICHENLENLQETLPEKTLNLLRMERETGVKRPSFPGLSSCLKRQTHIVETRQKVYLQNTHKHKAASRHLTSLNAPRIEKIKLVSLIVSVFYTLIEAESPSGYLASLSTPAIGIQGLYTSAGFQVLRLLPLGNDVRLQRLSFSVSKSSLSQ